jgi:hypothetical protein
MYSSSTGSSCSLTTVEDERSESSKMIPETKYAKSGEVHIAARVESIAKANEVIVSSTVKDLVSGSGIKSEDLGMHSLKGISEQWRLFKVNS